MTAKSIQGNSPREINYALRQYISQGFRPTLAVVFLSIRQDRAAVMDILQEHSIAIFGATSAGEFTDGEIHNGSIVILLMDPDPRYFKLLFTETSAQDLRASASRLAERAMQHFDNPSFIVAGSGLDLDHEALVKGIEAVTGSDTAIFGGIAADDFMMQDAFVFTNGRESTHGVIMLVVDSSKIDVRGRATCGWKPCGTTKTITKSQGQWIHTIDDQPALDLIVKYMGLDITPNDIVDPVLPKVGADYPLQLQRSQRDAVMRPLVFFNWDEHSVMVGGSVQEGDKIRFSLPADFEVIEDVVRECEEVKVNDLPEVDALILFECAGRLISLGPVVGKEIEGIRRIYGAPMAGLFTYGEIGKTANGNHEYHNFTCCWVGLKETK